MTSPPIPSSATPLGETLRNLFPGSNRNEDTDNPPVDINPIRPPPEMKTLVYSPEVRILIAHGNKQYDVSKDVVSCSIRRVENSVSSAVFRLANKEEAPGKLRYYTLFSRMDRVVIWLKRLEWRQVFSGYLDSVPFIQLYPGTVNFRASCTLKRLLHTWWDPGLPGSQQLFQQAGAHENEVGGELGLSDQGLGSLLRNLLVEVGGWHPSNVHIQRFPVGYYTFMEQQMRRYRGTEEDVQKFRRMLLGSDTSGGVGEAAGRQLDVSRGSYIEGSAARQLEVIRTVDEMGMGPNNTNMSVAQGLGTSSTYGEDEKDQPAWKGQTEVNRNWEEQAKSDDAAIHCFMTIMVESQWVMYANLSVPESLNFPHEALSPDGTSCGLYQQTNTSAWGTVAERMNVKASTGMFLRALDRYNWRNMNKGEACAMVQNPRSDLRWKYGAMEAAATELVRSIRGNIVPGSGASPTTGNATPGGLTGPSPLPISPPQNLVTTAAGSMTPNQNGTPSPAGAGPMMGRPQYDTQGAVSYAVAQLGHPYVWGGEGPGGFDCSGLTHMAYKSIGLEIGRNTTAQKSRGQPVAMANLIPGDLIFPAESDHVVMFLGGGQIIEAPQPGDVVKTNSIYFDPSAAVYRHYPPATWGGPGFAPFNPAPQVGSPGALPGTVAPDANGGTRQTGPTEPIARNLFSWMFEPGRFASDVSMMFGATAGQEEKAFINDEPLIQMVQAMAKAGLRNFCSAPNGDFVGYYPDYFGLDQKRAVMDLEDIELKDVQIDLNDDAMATHVYVAGSIDPRGSGNGTMGWLASKGVATVENEWLFRTMTMAAPDVPGEEHLSGAQILRKFGARPLVQSMPQISSAGPLDFLQALQIFMMKWAEQYSTTVQFTFMPELYPGMRVNLKQHNLQVYVAAVVHNCDFEAGFTTTATIMAPSKTSFLNIANTLSDVIHFDLQNVRDEQNQTTVAM